MAASFSSWVSTLFGFFTTTFFTAFFLAGFFAATFFLAAAFFAGVFFAVVDFLSPLAALGFLTAAAASCETGSEELKLRS